MRSFFKENDILFEKIAKKYKYDKHINFDYEKASQKEIDKFEQFQIKYGEYFQILDQYKFMSNQAKGKSKDLYFTSILSIGAILSIVLGFCSLQWSMQLHIMNLQELIHGQRKRFLMKIGFGLIIIFAFVLISSFLNYMIIKTSNYEILKTGISQIQKPSKVLELYQQSTLQFYQ